MTSDMFALENMNRKLVLDSRNICRGFSVFLPLRLWRRGQARGGHLGLSYISGCKLRRNDGPTGERPPLALPLLFRRGEGRGEGLPSDAPFTQNPSRFALFNLIKSTLAPLLLSFVSAVCLAAEPSTPSSAAV